MNERHNGQSAYLLGHGEEELRRLISQGRYFGELTADVLRLAGLSAGMRVLDAGCGAGDVSFLAAEIVGPEGVVFGVDRSPEACDAARSRAKGVGLENIRFVSGDLATIDLPGRVDAVIGRLVLMYAPDPPALVRRLAKSVEPGGIVAFQEIDLDGARSEPACSVFDTAVARVRDSFARSGIDAQMGLKLGRIFEEAGLPTPRMILGARVERGPEAMAYDQLTQITRTLLPVMKRTGIAGADEVGIETLADRMREEAVARNATVVSPSLIGAWTRI
jgi:SAM-dependent methyltransferase